MTECTPGDEPLPQSPQALKRRRLQERIPLTRKLAYHTVAALFSATVLLVGLEVLCRVFDPIGISYYPETAAYIDTLVVEEGIGYRNRPNLSGRFYGVPVVINSIGMRDREIPESPGPGEFRVAILGDSVPFGIGVSYEDSIPAVLEKLMNERARPGVVFRTLNLGVPSYNTEQELRQLQTLGLSLRPNLVVLIFSTNDIRPKMWVLEKRDNWLVNLAQRSYSISLLAKIFWGARSALSPNVPPVFVEEYRPDNPRWTAIDRSLTAIHALCRERGIPLVVLHTDDRPGAPEMVRAVGEREGFPVLPLVPWWDARWPEKEFDRYRNSRSDSHPNVEGSKVYATVLFERLAELGVLDGLAESASAPRPPAVPDARGRDASSADGAIDRGRRTPDRS